MRIYNRIPSKTLKSIYDEGYGYRNENFRGSRQDDPIKVLLYEIEELGNYHMRDELAQSMIEYCKELYTNDKSESQDPLSDKVHSKFIMDIIVQMKDLSNEKFVKESITRLTKNHPEDYFVLWLTTKQNVEEFYSYKGEKNEISVYPIIKENSICLCDLGSDGCLFLLERKMYNKGNNNLKELYNKMSFDEFITELEDRKNKNWRYITTFISRKENIRFEIYIRLHDDVTTPRFFVISKEKKISCCIELLDNRYFNYGSKFNYKLTKDERESMVGEIFENEWEDIFDDYTAHYGMVKLWYRTSVYGRKPSGMRIKQPNYKTIKPYKD